MCDELSLFVSFHLLSLGLTKQFNTPLTKRHIYHFNCFFTVLSCCYGILFYALNIELASLFLTGVLSCVAAHSCYVCIDCENNSGSLQDCTNIAKSYNSLYKSLGALTGASSSSGPSNTCITLTMGGIGKLFGNFWGRYRVESSSQLIILALLKENFHSFRFCYFANGKFAKFKSRLLLYF